MLFIQLIEIEFLGRKETFSVRPRLVFTNKEKGVSQRTKARREEVAYKDLWDEKVPKASILVQKNHSIVHSGILQGNSASLFMKQLGVR